jgi:cell wall-associated NlpC family hydrolase
VRRALGTLICAVAVLALSLCGSAAAAGSGDEGAARQGGIGALGNTVLTAIASTTNADEALARLGDSLVLMEARDRIARAEARAAAAPPPQPEAEAEAGGDPAAMPAASAGSNGSVSPSTAAKGGQIFAHSRAASAPGSSNAILLTGIALAPPDAPEAVQGVINNANEIVGRPYVWGGGHASFYSYGYDCSGAVSFALFGGGLIPEPLASVPLESWGAPGPGKWITVYANSEHAFAEIDGLRWDTVGDAQGTGPRWHLAPTSTAGFVARHPPGL